MFATLTLMPKKLSPDDTEIKFNVDKFGYQYTLKSNLAFDGKDYLRDVANLHVHITTGNCNVKLQSQGFEEYDDDLSFEEFNQKWTHKVAQNSNLVMPIAFVKKGINRSMFHTIWV
ncbi:MAG: hypothetical protein GXP45_07345 [bacterium]|nr:hypothetical protein [bacterium]